MTLEDDQIRRQEVMREAVGAANRVIMEGSEGSTEETDYLTAMVAKEFVIAALRPLEYALLKSDSQRTD